MSAAGKAVADWASFDAEETRAHFSVSRDDGNMESTLTVKGIKCGSCSLLIERTLMARGGVREVTVNVAAGTVRVLWSPAVVRLSELLQEIEAAGFEPAPTPGSSDCREASSERRTAMLRIGIAGIGAMQVMMYAVALYAGAFQGIEPAHEQFLRLVSLLVATPVVVYSGRPFFVSAWQSLRSRHAGMDVPVALAIGTAFLASVWTTLFAADGLQHEVYFDSAVMFVFLLSLGRYLETAARHKTAGTSQALAAMIPSTAARLNADGSVTNVPVVTLRPGDHVLCPAGEPIAADGEVLQGDSHVNEAMLTGESEPVAKAVGNTVVGGSINVSNPLTIRVTETTDESVLSNIARLIDRALTQKPAQVSLADRIASWFIVGVLTAATGTFFYWSGTNPALAFPAALAVLVVTCPCALSLATPAALTAAIGRLARGGVLTANSDAMERLARVTHVVFDKTGTLTTGTIEVTDIRALNGSERAEVLGLTAALEHGVTHPVGHCLERAALDGGGTTPRPQAEAVTNHAGLGIEGTIDGTVYRIGRPDFVARLSDSTAPHGDVLLGSATGVLAAFDLSDTLRDGARAAVDALKAEGINVCIASGDSPRHVTQIAGVLGIEHAWSRLAPSDKLERIRALQRAGAIVAVVGDGVNDGPVLAGADVSMAMADGTALAQASADLVLVNNRLEALNDAIDVARRCRRIVRQNLTWAIGYNSLALPAAAAAMLAPWMAAVGMSLSSLAVVLNAVRLNRGAAA